MILCQSDRPKFCHGIARSRMLVSQWFLEDLSNKAHHKSRHSDLFTSWAVPYDEQNKIIVLILHHIKCFKGIFVSIMYHLPEQTKIRKFCINKIMFREIFKALCICFSIIQS